MGKQATGIPSASTAARNWPRFLRQAKCGSKRERSSRPVRVTAWRSVPPVSKLVRKCRSLTFLVAALVVPFMAHVLPHDSDGHCQSREVKEIELVADRVEHAGHHEGQKTDLRRQRTLEDLRESLTPRGLARHAPGGG